MLNRTNHILSRCALAFIALFVVMAWSSESWAKKIRVVTTTTDLRHFVEMVGADQVHVDALCHGNEDPHSLQAKPSYMVQMSRADLLIAVGFDLESAWLPALIQGARNPAILPGKPGYLEASAGIVAIDTPISVDRSQGDLHPSGNPHYWLDPDNALTILTHVAAALQRLDPEHAAIYRANAGKYRQQLEIARTRWQAQMAAYRGRPVVSYHQTFNYFIRRYGLTPVGYVESRPGIPPAPAHLLGLIKTMQAHKVRVVFHENFYDARASEIVAGRSPARVLKLPVSVEGIAGASTYIELIDHIVQQFVSAVK